MNLADISFPVYKLGNNKPIEEDGVIFYYYTDPKSQEVRIQVVDDKSIEGEHLAQRRLKLFFDPNVKLYSINTAVFFIGDLIRIATSNTWLIDSSGKLFQYTKSRMVPLIYKRITHVIRGVSQTLIEVEGSNARYKVLFPPADLERYAGMLKLGAGYILYGFSKEKLPNSRRKI